MKPVEVTRVVPLKIPMLPVWVCHCPECFPDPRCVCRLCEAQRQRLHYFMSSLSPENP